MLSYADRGAASDGALRSSDGGGGCINVLLVERVEEVELDAMEAALRHCYTEQLCDVGGDVSAVSVDDLLRILVLADR